MQKLKGSDNKKIKKQYSINPTKQILGEDILINENENMSFNESLNEFSNKNNILENILNTSFHVKKTINNIAK